MLGTGQKLAATLAMYAVPRTSEHVVFRSALKCCRWASRPVSVA